MSKPIRLRKMSKTILKYCGRFTYYVVHDENAGMPNVYTVLAGHIDNPVVIGRELDLKWARLIISKYEEVAPEIWFGYRKDIVKCAKKLYPNCKF